MCGWARAIDRFNSSPNKRLTSRKGVDVNTSGEKIFEIACGCFIVISLATGLFLLLK
jgi:hypothetical protein